MKRLLIGLIALAAVAAGAAYYQGQERVSFHVLFTAAKELAVGDSVYLSGLPVGEVVTIEPEQGKIGVAVHVDRRYRDQITSASSFFIGPDTAKTGHMSLLVRTPTANGGSRLAPDDRVEGIDSPLVWSGREMADRLHEMIRSQPWQDLLQEVERIAQEFKQALKRIDIDRLGAELRADIETLSKDIDAALQGKETKEGLKALQEQIEEVQQRLKRLGDSEESRQLREALDNFQKRLREELRRDHDASTT